MRRFKSKEVGDRRKTYRDSGSSVAQAVEYSRILRWDKVTRNFFLL
jgi:hypothetical protein